jgi:hypothetical protein
MIRVPGRAELSARMAFHLCLFAGGAAAPGDSEQECVHATVGEGPSGNHRGTPQPRHASARACASQHLALMPFTPRSSHGSCPDPDDAHADVALLVRRRRSERP